MWFKNLTIFPLSEPFTIPDEVLETRLAERTARKCGALEMSTFGWQPPLPEGSALTLKIGNRLLIAAKRQEKILPMSVVKEALDEKVAQLEADENREIAAREKRQLKEEITLEMLPRAFTKSRTIYALIDPEKQWLLIDSASAKQAEELTVLLRESIGSLKIGSPLDDLEISPAQAMSRWLFHGNLPTNFALDDECEIHENSEQAGIMRCKNMDITQPNIRKQLEQQSFVAKLAMTWNDRVSFVLDQELGLRRIKPLEVIAETQEEIEAEDKNERFIADTLLFTEEITPLLEQLTSL